MYKSLTIFIFLLFYFCSFGQGIDFYSGEWKDAIEEANKAEKLVFVDAYTTWCGPCKKMSRDVFPDSEVGEYYNQNFINLKIDMESESGRAFGSKYPVSAYPTLLFINGKGDVVYKVTGFKPVEMFLAEGAKALTMDDRSVDMQAEYEKGNRDYDFIIKYIKALNRVKKPSLKVANDFLKSTLTLTNEQRAMFLYEALTEIDSRIYNLFIENKKDIAKVKTEAEINNRIITAAYSTVQKAIDFEFEMLLTEAQEKVQKSVPKEASAFKVNSNMNYFEGLGNTDRYLKEAKQYADKIIKKDVDQLVDLSSYMAEIYKNHKEAIALAERIAERATKLEENSNAYLNYSKILFDNNKKEKALKAANSALKVAQKKEARTEQIERYIKYIEAS